MTVTLALLVTAAVLVAVGGVLLLTRALTRILLGAVIFSNGINVLREDVVKHPITHEEALFNAPDKDADFFHVAKVIG